MRLIYRICIDIRITLLFSELGEFSNKNLYNESRDMLLNQNNAP